MADTVENGNVLFDIDVDGAVLYLNGKETDYTEGMLTLPVGTYTVRVSADGYDNYQDKIEVKADYQKVNIRMKKEEEICIRDRFSAQLGFGIEENTASAAKELAVNRKRISSERIHTEFNKMLKSAHPDYFSVADAIGIMEIVLPEYHVMLSLIHI